MSRVTASVKEECLSKSSGKQRSVAAPCPTMEEQQVFLSSLHQLDPKAAILTTTMIQPHASSSTNEQKWLPLTIMSYSNSSCSQDRAGEALKEECTRILNAMSVSKEEVDYIPSRGYCLAVRLSSVV